MLTIAAALFASQQRQNSSTVPAVSECSDFDDCHGRYCISDALPFGRLWYGEPDAITRSIGYAKHYRRSSNAVIFSLPFEPAKKGGHPHNRNDRPKALPSKSASQESLASLNMHAIYAQTMQILSS